MVERKKPANIGMREGQKLSNLKPCAQLDLIAQGFPVLMTSAHELRSASKSLCEYRRAACILMGHADEELAKILILMDIVRCPSGIRSSKIGPMMKSFYCHLARLIYIEAHDLKYVGNIKDLQEQVNSQRKSHSLEGDFGQYIVPNGPKHLREMLLYADIEMTDEEELIWNNPYTPLPSIEFYEQTASRLCEALEVVGAFTREGLEIVSDVWSEIDFIDDQDRDDAKRLAQEMLSKLQDEKLVTNRAEDKDFDLLADDWQLPMYHIEFKRCKSDLSALRDAKEANIRAEMGHW